MEEDELLFNQAKIFYRKGKYDRALQHVSNLLQSSPKSAQLLSLSAICKAKLGKLQEAERDAQAALNAEPQSGYPHCALAVIRAAQKKGKEAEAELGSALKLSPSDAISYFERAQLYKSAGRKADAAADLEKAASLDTAFSELTEEAASLRKSLPPSPTLGAVSGETDATLISNEFFEASVPKGWTFDIRENLYIFKSEESPDVTFTLSILPSTAEQIKGMDSSFYQFVEEEAKKKPFKVLERRIGSAKAKEAHVTLVYGTQKMHSIHIGYPGKTAFYLINFTGPENAPAERLEEFEGFLGFFVPAGMKPGAGSAAVPKSHSIGTLVASAALAVLGFAIIVGAVYIVVSAPESARGNAPLAPALLASLLGFILIGNAAFKFNPHMIYVLNFVFYTLVAALFSVSYLAFNSSSLILFGSAGVGGFELTGMAAQALAVLLMLKCVALAMAGIALVLYSKTKHVELDQAYLSVYRMLSDKIKRR